MITIYEHLIEICLNPVLGGVPRRNDFFREELLSLSELYAARLNGAQVGATQEQALIRLFWKRRADNEYALAAENGCIVSYHNCVLKLLFGVFGVDVVAYLFGQLWVPCTTISNFRPKHFLHRLSVLERATALLKDGSETPLLLPETMGYVKAGLGPRLRHFREEKHRFLLQCSLSELRDFGELALSLRNLNKNTSVYIHIYTGHDYDSEILQFARPDYNPDAE